MPLFHVPLFPLFLPVSIFQVLVSPADCRLGAFPSVMAATKLWIKGNRFTVEELLGPELTHEAPNFLGGSVVVCRLAPQDYHRWHMPCEGVCDDPVRLGKEGVLCMGTEQSSFHSFIGMQVLLCTR